jgi:hypothetical protein
MTTTASKSKSLWQADVQWGKRYFTSEEHVPTEETEETTDGAVAKAPEMTTVMVQHTVAACFVHFSRPGCDRMSFLVSTRSVPSLAH